MYNDFYFNFRHIPLLVMSNRTLPFMFNFVMLGVTSLINVN